MRKEEAVYLMLGIILIIIIISFIYLVKNIPRYSPEVFTSPVPKDCSEQEIKKIWESIFQESSENIKIIASNQEAQDKCRLFAAIKIIEPDTNTEQNNPNTQTNTLPSLCLGNSPDNNLDSGEECDTDKFIPEIESKNLECSAYNSQFTSGKVVCTNLCKISTENCLTQQQTLTNQEIPQETPQLSPQENNFYIVTGIDLFFFINLYIVEASTGKATESYLETLKSIQTIEELNAIIKNFDPNNILIPSLIEKRDILTTDEATTIFNSMFKISPTQWQTNATTRFTNYIFTDNVTNNTAIKAYGGAVNTNYSLNTFIYTEIQKGPVLCTTNWTEVSTPCNITELKTIWYNDTNSCNYPQPLYHQNKTVACDYDRNNLIGNESSPKEINLDYNIYIDGELLNSSKTYNQTKTIQIREGDIIRVEFSHNFEESPLNLTNIKIEKQSSNTAFGYLITEGITDNKKITLDWINRDTTKICIRNSAVLNITIFSQRCNSRSEVLLDCPEESNGFSCKIEDNKITIRGLTSSAVKQIQTTIINNHSETCIPSWVCTAWSDCANNLRTKTCTDLNYCGTSVGKPQEIENCALECTPEWQCTGWSPIECPENSKLTRTCIDLKKCNILTNKPSEIKSCGYKEEKTDSSGWLTLAIIIFLLIFSILAIIIYLILKPQHPTLQPTNITSQQKGSQFNEHPLS